MTVQTPAIADAGAFTATGPGGELGLAERFLSAATHGGTN